MLDDMSGVVLLFGCFGHFRISSYTKNGHFRLKFLVIFLKQFFLEIHQKRYVIPEWPLIDCNSYTLVPQPSAA